jgi:plastocyanin
MVFAVNPPADPDPRSFNAFKNLAMGASGTTAETGAFTTPPPQQWQTATATLSSASSVWTTTYTSYDGTPRQYFSTNYNTNFPDFGYPAPTFAPQPIDHKITVGANGQLSYNPPNITAAIGDTVTFEFHPKNHTVTQSSFNDPCRPLADTSTSGRVGFDSQL